MKAETRYDLPGHTEIKITCMIRVFKLVQNVRIYKPEEEIRTNILRIVNGNSD